MTTCIALLRGINVGKAKRIAMADLRALVAGLGFTNVRTLLNSGNVVFEAPRASSAKLAATISQAIESTFGFPVRVVVLTSDELDAVVAANPLLQLVRDPSKHLIAFSNTPTELQPARELLKRTWEPDAFAVADRAAYLWCAGGVLESPLMQAFARATRDDTTARNWATVLKLQIETRSKR